MVTVVSLLPTPVTAGMPLAMDMFSTLPSTLVTSSTTTTITAEAEREKVVAGPDGHVVVVEATGKGKGVTTGAVAPLSMMTATGGKESLMVSSRHFPAPPFQDVEKPTAQQRV